MENMHNFKFKVLEFLRLHSDSEFHEIEALLGEEFAYQNCREYRQAINELINDRLIEIKEGTGIAEKFPPTWLRDAEYQSIKVPYRPLEVRLIKN
jgi:hypothetical protein